MELEARPTTDIGIFRNAFQVASEAYEECAGEALSHVRDAPPKGAPASRQAFCQTMAESCLLFGDSNVPNMLRVFLSNASSTEAQEAAKAAFWQYLATVDSAKVLLWRHYSYGGDTM